MLGPHGTILARYDKRHLVPFGEYLPARRLLARVGLEKLTEGSLDFSAGTTPVVVTVPGLPAFAAAICYEAIFPESARRARVARVPEFRSDSEQPWMPPCRHQLQRRLMCVWEKVFFGDC